MVKKKKSPVNSPENPEYAAWFTAFFLKNHIDPFAYPTKVASKEQIEFMVRPDNDERYYPCSDQMFEAIMSRTYPAFLKGRYQSVLERILNMINEFIEDEYDREFLTDLVKIKYEDETNTGLLIPSRLEKRLYKIFLSRTHIENPYSSEKRKANRKAKKFLDSETFKKALNRINDSLGDIGEISLSELREKIRAVEFKRLISLLAHRKLWATQNPKIPTLDRMNEMFHVRIEGNGMTHLLNLLERKKQKILWLSDESGEVIIDLAIARFLSELGHAVIFAVKENPFFTKVCLADTKTDPALAKEFENAHFIYEKTISKNDLVNLLKHDKNIYVVSDGTREDLNLLLASTTFSRIFKEVDCVISRGAMQKEKLIDSHFMFTQDIINITREKNVLHINFKGHHPEMIKFSHQQLEEKAGMIIREMEKAKERGMTVMFYSGIIGSIPGKIDVAKKIMSTFIEYLQNQGLNLFIINPSNYYEPGMDADDLMYMWEIVQRSGVINIWRFQTSDDIEQSFSIMGKKVPPEWIGKDSTYSTGCTKEIRIAQDVLLENPEMQLIGPAIDKFMRRDEYGVGSMYDQRLAGF